MDHDRQLGEDAGVRAELRGEHAIDLFLRRDRSITRDRLDRLATPLVDRARDDECVAGGKAKLDLHRGYLGLAADLVGALHAGHVAEDSPRRGHDQRCLADAVRGHDERGAGPKLEIEPVVGAPVLELQTLDHRVPISLLNASFHRVWLQAAVMYFEHEVGDTGCLLLAQRRQGLPLRIRLAGTAPGGDLILDRPTGAFPDVRLHLDDRDDPFGDALKRLPVGDQLEEERRERFPNRLDRSPVAARDEHPRGTSILGRQSSG